MLEFAARHEISPIINRDESTADRIVRCMENLSMGRTWYRGVLYAVEDNLHPDDFLSDTCLVGDLELTYLYSNQHFIQW